VVAGHDEDCVKVQPCGFRDVAQPLLSPRVLVVSAACSAERDVACHEDRVGVRRAGGEHLFDVLAQRTEHQLLVLDVRRVTVPKVDVGELDPTEERMRNHER
jgi:hypothetical protein